MMDAERLAQAAKGLLDSEATKEAFTQIEQDLFAQWKACSALAHKKREKLWFELKAIESLKSKLQTFVDHGRLTAANRK
jgi:hypothetical protein